MTAPKLLGAGGGGLMRGGRAPGLLLKQGYQENQEMPGGRNQLGATLKKFTLPAHTTLLKHITGR